MLKVKYGGIEYREKDDTGQRSWLRMSLGITIIPSIICVATASGIGGCPTKSFRAASNMFDNVLDTEFFLGFWASTGLIANWAREWQALRTLGDRWEPWNSLPRTFYVLNISIIVHK